MTIIQDKDLKGALKEAELDTNIGAALKNRKVLGSVINEQTLESFDVLQTDDLDDILDKYAKTFKVEAYLFGNQVRELMTNQDNAKGMSKQRLFRLAFSLPNDLHAVLRKWFPYYLNEKAGLKKLRDRMSVCFIGG